MKGLREYSRGMSMVFLFILGVMTSVQVSADVERPERFFGFKPGTDRMLFDYETLIQYLQKLDQASPRVALLEIGSSPMGKKLYVLFISSEENIGNLESLREINRRLALDPGIPDPEREKMIRRGRVFVLATLSMHSSEVGPTQSLPLIAYDLATTADPVVMKWLDNVVYMIVPCHNPDGMDMIVENYNRYKGTKYEGSSMPGIYHKYTGHDNNRDFITLSQSDTKAIAAIYNRDWFPQVMVEKHQMGTTGPQYFVPPPHDPITENIDAGVWNWVWIFGSNLAKDMTEKGLKGISQHYLFDDYWPGSTETALWKNVIGFLTEAASAKVATPIFVEPIELNASGKGLAEYKKSINMTLPWPGGWWKLSDIVEYEVESFISILRTASQNREAILKFRNDLCRKEVERGRLEPPFYYILPAMQHDLSELVALVNLLREHGVDVYRLSAPVQAGERTFREGDIVIPLSQPFRPFIKEVMERQSYPIRHYTPGGEIIKPYDVTSWSLPLHRDIESIEAHQRSSNLESKLQKITDAFHLRSKFPEKAAAAIFNVNNNESFMAAFTAIELGMSVERLEKSVKIVGVEFPAGSFIVPIGDRNRNEMKKLLEGLPVSPVFAADPVSATSRPLKVPRIALVESYFHDMDAGWTRFLFDSYHIPYRVIRPGDFKQIDFAKEFDLVLLPDQDDAILKEGKRKPDEDYFISDYPPEFAEGIGDKGMEALMTFIDKGGIIVSWGRSTKLFMETLKIPLGEEKKEEFQLPVRDLSKKFREAGFFCPGSFLKVDWLEEHPLTLGIDKRAGLFSEGKIVFSTSLPNLDMDRRIIASFPEKEILLSGYCEKEAMIGRKPALAWFKKGKGQFVLFGFNPQFRASTPATFKLIFNSILLDKIKE
ncbi:MAG: M14 metallopeptidase family protein [Acidobacteriota bacterium]